MKTSILILLALAFVGCSKSEPPTPEHKRDEAFFKQFVNPTAEFSQAETNLNQMTLITVSEIYNMRYALFEDGRFYYQVEKLGNGHGKWSYRNGYLNLHATRTFFDLNLSLQATQPEGDAMELQFIDRHGLNKAKVEVQKPTAQPLRQFEAQVTSTRAPL